MASRSGGALFLVRHSTLEVERLEAWCRENGLEVELADNGLEGLHLAKRRCPRLLLTEIILPGLDGLALCRRLREDPATAQVRVVALSTLSAERPAREAGADAFHRLPVDPALLVNSARRILRGDGHQPMLSV